MVKSFHIRQCIEFVAVCILAVWPHIILRAEVEHSLCEHLFLSLAYFDMHVVRVELSHDMQF